MPTAADVRDAEHWAAAGVSINPNAKKISILIPIGKGRTGFSEKPMYDISQTAARDLRPEQKTSLRQMLLALMDFSPVPLSAANELPEPVVFDREANTIFLRRGQSEAALLPALAKEIAAAKYQEKGLDRDQSRLHSWCVSYMLMAHLGAETGPLALDMQELTGLERDDLRQTLNELREVLTWIQDGLYGQEKNPGRQTVNQRIHVSLDSAEKDAIAQSLGDLVHAPNNELQTEGPASRQPAEHDEKQSIRQQIQELQTRLQAMEEAEAKQARADKEKPQISEPSR